MIASGVYGWADADLAPVAPDAVQFSPLIPGSERIEDCADSCLSSFVMRAPAGVIERRFALAQALRTLAPDGILTASAPNERGGTRIARELADFGCAVDQSSRRHHRICRAVRPADPVGLGAALAAGAPQMPPALGLWSQPGVFSWDRPDPGSLALIGKLPRLSGVGADFGCGVGLLARALLENPAVSRLTLIDIDRRAIDAAKRNIADERARFVWADVREYEGGTLDFIVMNPPFHDGGIEDRALGEAFIRRAAACLKPGGPCWLVANRHLPYEAHLGGAFAVVRQVEQSNGYKIYEARR